MIRSMLKKLAIIALKDKYGWPIEQFKGRPVKSFVRIVLQNLRRGIQYMNPDDYDVGQFISKLGFEKTDRSWKSPTKAGTNYIHYRSLKSNFTIAVHENWLIGGASYTVSIYNAVNEVCEDGGHGLLGYHTAYQVFNFEGKPKRQLLQLALEHVGAI